MLRTRRPAAFAALLVSLALVAPSRAEAATKSQRDAARSRRAEAAARLNALRATDRELTSAVGTLTQQVNTQIDRVTAARRASAAADASYAKAAAALKQTEDRINNLHGAVVTQAIKTYMRPGGPQRQFDSDNLAVASRQRALIDHVEHQQGDVLDELRAARQDLALREAIAARSRDRATERKEDASAQLRGLARDLNDKQRLSAALATRIREAEEEDLATASSQGSLDALLGGSVDLGAISRAGLAWPLKGRLTSGFGMRWGRLHAGIDIAAPRGTPIRAAKAGTVVFSGWMGGYGNAIIINHGGGLATLYGHQSRRAASVGDKVKQGQVIGYVGSTGHSTGNHLHFETRVGGKPQNPGRFLP